MYEAPPIQPPIAVEPKPFTPTAPPVAKWRSAVMFILLASYVLWAGLKGQSATDTAPALPGTSGPLLLYSALNLLVFAGVFVIAWLFGRTSRADLYGAQKIQVLTVVLGFVWSILLRMMLVVLMLGVVAILVLSKGKVDSNALQEFRPKVEHLFSPGALKSPLYSILCMTWVSFIVAGLREELWRAGVIASLRAMFPAEWPGRRWEWTAVLIASGLFGLGHLTQGWAAVGLTTTLGLGLGGIMVLRRSLPEAILAHGFFDSFTFACLTVITNRALLERLLHGLGMGPDEIKQLTDQLGKLLGN